MSAPTVAVQHADDDCGRRDEIQVSINDHTDQPGHSSCWACDAVLVVPTLASRYKCGWCGAINPPPGATPGGRRDGQGRLRSGASLAGHLHTCTDHPSFQTGVLALGGVVTTIVCLIVGGISIAGSYFVVWRLFGFRGSAFAAHVAVTAFLDLNIMTNYFLAVVSSPGSVSEFYSLAPAPQAFSGQFNDHQFCQRCKNHKPPGTHHCNVCGVCVVGMDHHCPFINNCVGRGNMRHFLLFLLWVVLAMLYAVPLLAVALYRQRHVVTQAWSTLRASSGSSGRLQSYGRLKLALGVVASLPPSLCITGYLWLVCVMFLFMVGFLCGRHWWLAATGATIIGQLQGEQLPTSDAIQNLRAIFGAGPVARWLFPKFARSPRHEDVPSKFVKGA